MKEQFTPGEWVNKGDNELMTFGTIVVGPALVEFDRGDDESYKQAMRDADLFAVSKKMYRLLQKFLPCDEDGNGIGDFVYSDGSECLGEEVIALLAEARGENNEHSN